MIFRLSEYFVGLGFSVAKYIFLYWVTGILWQNYYLYYSNVQICAIYVQGSFVLGTVQTQQKTTFVPNIPKLNESALGPLNSENSWLKILEEELFHNASGQWRCH